MRPARALAALEQAMLGDSPQAIVIDADWAKLAKDEPTEIFTSVIASRTRQAAVEIARGDLRRQLESCEAPERRAVLIASIRRMAARVLGMEESQVLDIDQPLSERGLDSMMALDLAKQLGDATGTTLRATLLFNHPTVEALADHLGELIFPPAPMPSTPATVENADIDAFAKQMDDMSQSELEALLETELAEMEELVAQKPR
jgi:acyl carrier protein